MHWFLYITILLTGEEGTVTALLHDYASNQAGCVEQLVALAAMNKNPAVSFACRQFDRPAKERGA